MSVLQCHDLQAALTGAATCVATPDGMRLTTQCLYPGFDPVHVFVVAAGGGFTVHDGAGGARVAWDHGRNHAGIAKALAQQALAYRLRVIEDALVTTVESQDWLVPAILAVANASAAAAHAALETTGPVLEENLLAKIEAAIKKAVGPSRMTKGFVIAGESGKEHTFDFAARVDKAGRWIVIAAVTPHHASVSSKYVAFADTMTKPETVIGALAVYERPLAKIDMALLSKVAELTPIDGLRTSLGHELAV